MLNIKKNVFQGISGSNDGTNQMGLNSLKIKRRNKTV